MKDELVHTHSASSYGEPDAESFFSAKDWVHSVYKMTLDSHLQQQFKRAVSELLKELITDYIFGLLEHNNIPFSGHDPLQVSFGDDTQVNNGKNVPYHH